MAEAATTDSITTTRRNSFTRRAAAAASAAARWQELCDTLDAGDHGLADDAADQLLEEAAAPWERAFEGLVNARPATAGDLAEKARLAAHAVHHVFGLPSGSTQAQLPRGQIALRLMAALVRDCQALAGPANKPAPNPEGEAEMLRFFRTLSDAQKAHFERVLTAWVAGGRAKPQQGPRRKASLKPATTTH